MAVLISKQTGNHTDSNTWYLADTTCFLDSVAASTALTTSYVASAATTPGAITVDGIGLHCVSRNAVPSGTMSVELYNSTGALSVKTVTINVSDLSSTANGWYFFLFDAPVTLLAATNYQVRAKTSATSMVTLYRDATAGNWSRFLRTNTTAAPAASDHTITCGEMTGAGTSNTFIVTMDSTSSATTYGKTEVCDKAEFNVGTTASTAYYYKLAGDFNIYGSAIVSLTHGTSGSMDLEFVCGSNVQYGLNAKAGHNLSAAGTAKSWYWTYLEANASAGATSLTTGVATGWKNGDSIGIASTTKTGSQCEKKSLTADASGSTLTIAALTNAHDGTDPYRAELINLSRSIRIFSSSTTLQTYVNLADGNFSFSDVEFYNMGSATANKRGIEANPITNEPSFVNCSLHDFNVASSIGIYVGNAASGGLYISNMVSYNIYQNHFNLGATTGTGHVIDTWVAIRSIDGSIFVLNDKAAINVTGAHAVGAGTNLYGFDVGDNGGFGGTFYGCHSHSNSGAGFFFDTCRPASGTATLEGIYSWRNNTHGISFSACHNLIIKTFECHGNTTTGVNFGTTASDNLLFLNGTVYSGASLTQARGVYHNIHSYGMMFENCSFGNTYTHSTADIDFVASMIHDVKYIGCSTNSATPFNGTGNLGHGQQGIADSYNNRYYFRNGVIKKDNSIYYGAVVGSLRMTPNTASFKLKSHPMRVFASVGQTVTITVYVRKSTAGDGSAYNGAEPRLLLRVDNMMGVTADTVCDTMTVGTGIWEQLTYTTSAAAINSGFTFYVDCDGNQGWINVDKVEVS